MNRQLNGLLRILMGLACLWLASACVHMSEMADGQTDILVGEDQRVRESLVISAVRPVGPLAYGDAPGCAYTHQYTTRGAQMESFRYTSARRRMGEGRVLIAFEHERGPAIETMDSAGVRSMGWPGFQSGQGTMLIESTGALRDFNVWSPQYTTRVTADNYTVDGAWNARRTPRQSHLRRDLTILIPHLLLQVPGPGDVVAHIRDERGHIWARYVYIGMTNYRQREAVVLDLTREHTSGGRTQTVLVGFLILSADTLVPLFQAGNGAAGPTRTVLVSCALR